MPWFTPSCPFFCSGHDAPANQHRHDAAPSLFGHSVTVVQENGRAPFVALLDIVNPMHTLTADEARVLGANLWRGAGLVDRFTFPLAADPVEQAMAALLAQRGLGPWEAP